MIWSAYIFEVTVNKKRMCEGGYGPVAFWMRIFAHFFISIFVSFSLSLFASGEFRCELPWFLSVRLIFYGYPVYTRIPSMHMQRHMHACMHRCTRIYPRILRQQHTRWRRAVYRAKTARIILSNKIISRHAELYNQLRSVVLCFFNREQILVFFGYVDTRVSTCVFFIREIVGFWKNVVGVIVAAAFTFERIHFWETEWVYLLMISNANEKYGLPVGS